MSRSIRIGTRSSALALVQSQLVKAELKKQQPGLEAELIKIKTTGDQIPAGERSPETPKLKGLFVKELEEALLSGEIDLAVHSAKDLETRLPEGLLIGAVLKREDPRDALVSVEGKPLEDLPAGARVGASSVRRQAQLKRFRQDLEVVPIRGNVDTRVNKMEAGEVDALILAGCGLIRLGLQEGISDWLLPKQFLPAPAQGALAIEVKADNEEILQLIQGLNDADSEAEIRAERAMLDALGGSCQVPIGALGWADGENLILQGAVLSTNGMKIIEREISGAKASPELLGKTLASHLRAAGADRLLFSAAAQNSTPTS